MPILDFNDPNPAFGGGGGSGLNETEIDTSGGSGDTTLPAFSGVTTGDYYLFTLSDPEYAGTIIADGSDTIDGAGTLAVGIGESVLLVVGASEWEEVARGPSRVHVTLAAGGDIVTLPALSTLPTGSVRVITYNDPGTSDPVEVQKDAGDAYDPVTYDGYIFNLYETQIFYHTGSAWEVKVPWSQVGYSPTYALEYAIVNGSLVSGSEMTVHHMNCNNPSDAIITSLSVTGAAFVTPPSVFIRGARSVTNATGGGPLVMNPSGATAPNSNRSLEIVFKLTASRTQQYVALAQAGTFSTNECFGLIRASTSTAATQAIDFQGGAGNAAGTGNLIPMWSDTSLIQNLWCYVCVTYDSVSAEYNAYWWADGDGAFSTGSLSFANAGTGTAQPLYLGGNGASFFTWPGEYAYIAMHDTVLSSDYRDSVVSLLGLS